MALITELASLSEHVGVLPNIAGSSLVNVPCRTIGGRPVGVLRLTDGARWPVERELELLLVLPVELTALRGW